MPKLKSHEQVKLAKSRINKALQALQYDPSPQGKYDEDEVQLRIDTAHAMLLIIASDLLSMQIEWEKEQ